MAVGLEGQGQLAEGVRHILLSQQGLIGDRLCLTDAAQAVNALQIVGDEEVAIEVAVLSAGDSTHVLLAF